MKATDNLLSPPVCWNRGYTRARWKMRGWKLTVCAYLKASGGAQGVCGESWGRKEQHNCPLHGGKEGGSWGLRMHSDSDVDSGGEALKLSCFKHTVSCGNQSVQLINVINAHPAPRVVWQGRENICCQPPSACPVIFLIQQCVVVCHSQCTAMLYHPPHHLQPLDLHARLFQRFIYIWLIVTVLSFYCLFEC